MSVPVRIIFCLPTWTQKKLCLTGQETYDPHCPSCAATNAQRSGSATSKTPLCTQVVTPACELARGRGGQLHRLHGIRIQDAEAVMPPLSQRRLSAVTRIQQIIMHPHPAPVHTLCPHHLHALSQLALPAHSITTPLLTSCRPVLSSLCLCLCLCLCRAPALNSAVVLSLLRRAKHRHTSKRPL